ncbi:hypothetical protein ACEWQ7_004883, partial [Salmonella enterica]
VTETATLNGTTIAGNSTNGTGVELAGNTSNSHITGDSVSGNGVKLENGSHASDSSITGNSVNGSGVHSNGTVQLNGTVVNGASKNGEGLTINGTLSHDSSSDINSSSGNGLSGGTTNSSGLGSYNQLVRQDAINSRLQNLSEYHRGYMVPDEVPLPVNIWEGTPENAEINICDGKQCQSLSVDIAKPGEMTPHNQ